MDLHPHVCKNLKSYCLTLFKKCVIILMLLYLWTFYFPRDPSISNTKERKKKWG